MPKYYSRNLNPQTLETAETVETVDNLDVSDKSNTANTVVANRVRLRLLINARYIVKGRYSGAEYLFDGAGSEVDVDERDVEYLLQLRRHKACCGGGDNPLFELAY
jgi:hypothetical protein